MDYEPSLVDDSRILAVRSQIDDEDNQRVDIETLAVGLETVTMTVCAAPWLPTEEGIECLTPMWDLLTDETLTATLDMSEVILPPELLAFTQSVYVKVATENTDVVPAILEICLTTPPDNPNLTGVLLNGVAPSEWTASETESIEVETMWENPGDETDTSISFYTSSGSFSPWRINDGGSSTWTPNSEDSDPQTIFVIARKLGLGATWTTVELNP